MEQDRAAYRSPFSARYASREMQRLFSEEFKFRTWRKLWIELARAEKELGLQVTDAQVAELERFADDINYGVAEAKEREIRHDVMAHVHAYAEQAPEGGKILHLGATSCYVGDNADIIAIRDALDLVRARLLAVATNLAAFAARHRATATLGFTHYQPAQCTTVGKRATLWLQDFLMDFREATWRRDSLRALGVKGTTGTQASYVNLFAGDHARIRELDRLVSERIGFPGPIAVSGQTYTRKVDAQVLDVLSGIAQSAHKFATDIRLLANLKEVEEPFEKKQVGSSAMAYKRNPMRSERICSLSRLVISLAQNPAYTAATQWFERTLDDSANRRIAIAEAFLATDAILLLLANVTDGLVVNEGMIRRHLDEELPFMVTENILMEGTKKGAGRQDLHEVIREHSHAAAAEVKAGGPNRLLALLADDPRLPLDAAEIAAIADAGGLVGRAPEQVDEFLAAECAPVLAAHAALLSTLSGEDGVKV